MVLVAGLLLLIATAIDAAADKPINQLYLGLGVVLVIFSTAMLIFRKNK
jgi:hypothetical protein